MRSETSSCFPTHDAMTQRHGWGAQPIAGSKSALGKIEEVCVSLRERSGWLWEWFSI
jgi:hypothetical protein